MAFYLLRANTTGSVDLQTMLAASSSGPDRPSVGPHHPISCSTTLTLDGDGALACEHACAPAGDRRTQACIDHSIAILLIELLLEKERT